MKTAIIFSGQLRNFEECFESLQMYILDNNNCDIYMQTYVDSEYDKAIKLFKPFRILLEQPTEDFVVHDKCKQSTNAGANGSMYWMHKNIKTAFDLILPNTYDCVLRTRYDLTYTSRLTLSDFIMSSINIPAGGDWLGGTNDLLAFSSYDNMKHYCSLIDHINTYVDGGVAAHAETLLKHHLRDINTNRFEFDVFLRGHNMTSDSRGRP